jgi:hypothetical protein
VVEIVRGAQCRPERVPVFDVACEVADARVEDVLHGVPSEEQVADDPHASSVDWVCPQPT